MNNTYLYERLIQIRDEKLTSFHVPGHKNGKLLSKYLDIEDLLSLDITEIPGADNLHNPESIIKNSQLRIANLYKTKKSYMLVNGTTCGIISMIMGTTKPGDKVIVVRDCHKSVHSGLALGQLEPVYIMPEIDIGTGLSLGITLESLREVIKDNADAKAVILTYPTYHGICSDIESIAKLVKYFGMFLLVDEAHGAHLKFSNRLPMSAIEAGADMVVHSFHKSLPALTQSSVLHINSDHVNVVKVEEMLKMHQSSSPSYLLMASLDIAAKIMVDEGAYLLEELIKNTDDFYESFNEASIKFIDKAYIRAGKGYDFDQTKITLLGKDSDLDPMALEETLRRDKGIQCEYSNKAICLCIATVCDDKDSLLTLKQGIETCEKSAYLPTRSLVFETLPEIKLKPNEVLYRERRRVRLEDALGQVSGDYIIPYPPGIPLVVPGEIIHEKLIQLLIREKELGLNILGLNDDGYINVIVD